LVAGLPGDPVDEVVAEITKAGGTAVGFTGDIALQDQAESYVQAALEAFGQLDILINNAGVFPEVAELDQFSVQAFEYRVKNNIYTTFHTSRAALPYLQKTRGNVVSDGSERAAWARP
jgi:NAD(P)-dependent dehydrogenase (short-subunit alcohol dehydrogenase family)